MLKSRQIFTNLKSILKGRAVIAYIFILIFYIFSSAYFSLAETAFTCVNRYKMRALAQNGNISAKLVLKILAKFDLTLIAILIGNNFVNIGLSFIATYLFLSEFSGVIDDGIILLISSIITTIIVYAFCEALPKQLGKKIPEKLALKIAWILLPFILILAPFTMIFYAISNFITRIFKTSVEPEITKDDFNQALEISAQNGIFDDEEKSVILNSFSFSDKCVGEILIPKNKMQMIDLNGLSHEKLLEILEHFKHSRIPLFYGETDKIVGILLVKVFLRKFLKNPNVKINECLAKPLIVPKERKIDEIISSFRRHKTQIALVYDGKNLLGMVTITDILGQLVGKIDEKKHENYANLRSKESLNFAQNLIYEANLNLAASLNFKTNLNQTKIFNQISTKFNSANWRKFLDKQTKFSILNPAISRRKNGR